MRTGPAQWSLAIGASVLAHLAVAAVLALTLAPDPVPRAPSPQSRLDLSSDPIERIAARPRDTAGEAVAEGRPEAASLPSGMVPSGRATPVAPVGEALAPAAAPSMPLAGRDAAATALPGTDLPTEPRTGPVPAPAIPLAVAAPAAETITAAAALLATSVATAQPETMPAQATTPEVLQLAATETMPPPLAAAAPAAQFVATAPMPATAHALTTPNAETVAATPPPTESAPAAMLPATAGSAAELPAPERLTTAPQEALAVDSAMPDATVVQPAVPAPESLARADTDTAPAPSATPAADRLASVAPPAAELPAAATDARVAAATAPIPDRQAVAAAEALSLPPAEPDAQSAPVAAPATERLASAVSDAASLPTAWPEGLAHLSPSPPAPDSVAVAPLHDLALIAAVAPATGERAQAALAWTGEGEGPIDPVSLAAIQSFMQPSDLARLTPGEDAVRDGISALLASVPCARMQTVFLPETGALELRGHIPEDGLREPVLAALQGQVGGNIPISDNLRVLPRPQCDVLTGIAALGLPQSTVQETDPRLVGPDAHAREYHYREGERLSFEVTTPDYLAHVYIDYYDAEGMVLHLQPNDLLDTTLMEPKSTLAAGADPMTGESVFDILVAPPFGNEIAVAFAASTPLHDTPRPVREPVGPYLKWLRTQIAEAREADPEFRGEWVYFFMSTAPRND